MKILFVSSEAAPFAKSGGLGDVVGALAPAMAAAGHQVLTVVPGYAHAAAERTDAVPLDGVLDVHAAGQRHTLRFSHLVREGAHTLFVHHHVFERGGLYGDANGTFGDNHLRFLFLCTAALEAALRLRLFDGEPLGEDIVVHAHDWQGALAPILVAARYRPAGVFTRARTVLTLHNVAHQGRMSAHLFHELGLPGWLWAPDGLEYYGSMNILKGGIQLADAITTVSPSYAAEIRTPLGGAGLHGSMVHRSNDLSGILNGIDESVWTTVDNTHLDASYTADDLAGKAVCKASLQRELGLPESPGTPMVAFIGRLDPQKGIELLVESTPWLVEEQRAQVVFLGSAAAAHRFYEFDLRSLEARYPDHVRAWIGYSERLAHRIEAGADLFAMPSRFEPCGLNQLYSLRYGTVPVVHATGGLRDSVEAADERGKVGTGYPFTPFDGFAFRTALWRGLDCWRNRPDAFRRIQRRGMQVPMSWASRVADYEAVYAG